MKKKKIEYIEWKVMIDGKEHGQRILVGYPMSFDMLGVMLTMLVKNINRSLKQLYEKT